MEGDSFALGKEIFRYSSCFSTLNNSIILNSSKNIDLKYSIILEKEKYSEYSKDDLNGFFYCIRQIGVIDFEEEYKKNGDLYLNLKYEKQNKAYLQYTGMVVRCLYQKDSDNFYVIAKHFLNLCKYFNKIDKGLLFTLACNIFCAEYKSINGSNSYGFNSNHILMGVFGCKLFKTSEIIEILNKDKGINEHFTNHESLEKYKLKDDSKESYLKLIEQNGIK